MTRRVYHIGSKRGFPNNIFALRMFADRIRSMGEGNCHAKRNNMEWQVIFEVCGLFRELQEIYQFSGLLAKCLVWSEPGYYNSGL